LTSELVAEECRLPNSGRFRNDSPKMVPAVR
jgi:hypothetical protein